MSITSLQGDHLSGKPENVRKFAVVREMSGNWLFPGEYRKKSCQGKLLFLINKPVSFDGIL